MMVDAVEDIRALEREDSAASMEPESSSKCHHLLYSGDNHAKLSQFSKQIAGRCSYQHVTACDWARFPSQTREEVGNYVQSPEGFGMVGAKEYQLI